VSVYFVASSAATAALVALLTAQPSLSQLRELGQLLIQIHGQHAHQQLLNQNSRKPCSMATRVSMRLLN
jgi:DNA repair ATPase RecN